MMGKLGLKVILPLVLVSLAVVLGFYTTARADLAVSEARLNPVGAAYEINPDDGGKLWITDSSAGQVWGVDPLSGAYNVFPVGGSPTDARQAAGYLWWADDSTNTLGQVKISDGTYSKWQVTGAINFLGTALDAQGRLYATDSINPDLYRLDAVTGEICTLAIPGAGNYVVHTGDYLWFADHFEIMRLQISTNSLTTWSLPAGSSLMGLAVDALGNLWYADETKVVIAQLDPLTNQLTSYALPNGYPPEMIAIQSGFIWYTTEQRLSSIGRLDPLVAGYTLSTQTVQSQTITPACSLISPSSTGTMTVTNGNLSWTGTTYPSILNTGGWKIYQTPTGSIPWGITIPASGYVVDLGRQELIRFTPPTVTTLIVIKHMINNNGGSSVASDFTISVNNPPAVPSTLPGAESPGTEVTVNPGAYSVSETGPNGYTASYSSACNGTMTTGQTKTCTVTNDDIAPTLHLRKSVTNDNGGTALATNWMLSAAGPTPLTGTTPVDSGATFSAGTYTLSESGGPTGYTASSWSCVKNGGAPVIGSSITLGLGDDATCTINNNDNAPSVHLHKTVINDNGGTALATNWMLSAAGPTPLSGTTPVDSGATFSAGTYILSESGGPASYTPSAWSCVKNGGAPVIGSSISLATGDEATCTIINDDNPPKIYLPIIRR